MRSPTTKILRIVLFGVIVQALFFAFVPQPTAQLGRKTGKSNVSHSLRITDIQCVKMPYRDTKVNYCKMEKHTNGTTFLNVSGTVQGVVNYFTVGIKAFYKYTTYRPFMIDWSMEYCQAARSRNYNPSTAFIMKIIEETVPEYSYPCPHGNRTYNKVWTFESRYIPEALPSGNYRLDVDIKNSAEEILFAGQLYAAVRRQGIIG